MKWRFIILYSVLSCMLSGVVVQAEQSEADLLKIIRYLLDKSRASAAFAGGMQHGKLIGLYDADLGDQYVLFRDESCCSLRNMSLMTWPKDADSYEIMHMSGEEIGAFLRAHPVLRVVPLAPLVRGASQEGKDRVERILYAHAGLFCLPLGLWGAPAIDEYRRDGTLSHFALSVRGALALLGASALTSGVMLPFTGPALYWHLRQRRIPYTSINDVFKALRDSLAGKQVSIVALGANEKWALAVLMCAAAVIASKKAYDVWQQERLSAPRPLPRPYPFPEPCPTPDRWDDLVPPC
ncbi:MAG: hypothetical protein QG604_979 [Candidatus Dependentiae bacterium]|nr:hypothetical protein [Candidatus Dependentiae bacterium]